MPENGEQQVSWQITESSLPSIHDVGLCSMSTGIKP